MTSVPSRLIRCVIRAAPVRKRFAAAAQSLLGPLPYGRGSVQRDSSNDVRRTTKPTPLAAFAVVLCFTPLAPAQQDAHTLVDRGNSLFADGDYAAALESYREAEVLRPESPELAYNQGLAYYKLQDFTAASDAFNRALLTRDLSLEAKIKYNLGDVAYASALEKESDLQEAIDLAKKAIGHYRDSLELDADDADAKANIETAQLLIKDLLDKLKKQQEEQDQQQDQDQDQEQQSDQQQDQESQDDQQEKQDGEDQQEPEDGGEEQEQPENGDPSEQEQQEQEQQQQPPEEGDDMTRDEAERVLQAVRDRERERRQERAKRRRVRRIPVLKDW